MRENDTILIADRCAGESNITKMNYITYSDENLPDDAGITVSDSALTFKARDIVAFLCASLYVSKRGAY